MTFLLVILTILAVSIFWIAFFRLAAETIFLKIFKKEKQCDILLYVKDSFTKDKIDGLKKLGYFDMPETKQKEVDSLLLIAQIEIIDQLIQQNEL